MRKICVCLVLILSCCVWACDNNVTINISNDDTGVSKSRKEGRYDYVYYNPPRQSLTGWGRYVMSTGTVRYTHSPSKLKRAAHAARIDAYNHEMHNY